MKCSQSLLGFCLLVGLCGCDLARSEYAVGTLERDRIHLAADSAEPIAAVDVREGDRVSAGAVLVRQNTDRIMPVLERTRAELAISRAQLAEAESGPRSQQIEQARARRRAAASAVGIAQRELDRQRSLIAQNYTSENAVDVLQERLEEAQARRQEIQAELALLEEGTRSELIDAARAEVRAREAAVSELEVSIARLQIAAPVAGIVDSLPMEIGERPQPGQTVAVLLSADRIYARVHVPEPIRTRLLVGDRALVTMDGYADALTGRVRWISADAAFTPYYALTQHDRSRLAYLAEIDLTAATDIPVGMPVEVRFPDLLQNSP